MAGFILDTAAERKWGFIGEFVARRLFGISPWAHINSVFVSSTHAKASDLVHDGRDTRAPFSRNTFDERPQLTPLRNR